MIEERIELTELFDIYKEMLTDKQRDVFEKYYFLDLSLAEIAEQLDISRAAVSDKLKNTKKQLYDLEEKIKVNQLYIKKEES